MARVVRGAWFRCKIRTRAAWSNLAFDTRQVVAKLRGKPAPRRHTVPINASWAMTWAVAEATVKHPTRDEEFRALQENVASTSKDLRDFQSKMAEQHERERRGDDSKRRWRAILGLLGLVLMVLSTVCWAGSH